ncbi:MAG: SH3 domain-containing protein [Chloroflexota bacterium]
MSFIVRRWFHLISIVLTASILAACLPDTRGPSGESVQVPTPEPSPTMNADVSEQETQSLEETPSTSGDIQQEEESTTTENEGEGTEPSPTPEIIGSETSEASAREYQVVFVEEDDVLNVRSDPGVEFEIVGELQPGARGVKITGEGQVVIDSLWVPVEYEDVSGWVNSWFLTEVLSEDDFCDDENVEILVDTAFEALVDEDSEGLSQLVAEGRSLRVRRHWWNPEVIFNKDEVANLFESEQSHSWGIADGSGNPIEGSFSEVFQPLIERNLEPSTERGCNEILHGGTAGLVQLPPSYEGINYYSFYRPAGPDDFELDWGTWVMGVEIWQGQPYLSFLVHYEWEI